MVQICNYFKDRRSPILDKKDLLKRIRANNMSVTAISRLLSIERSTFYRKLNGGRFTVDQANVIRKALRLSDKEALDIFLP